MAIRALISPGGEIGNDVLIGTALYMTPKQGFPRMDSGVAILLENRCGALHQNLAATVIDFQLT